VASTLAPDREIEAGLPEAVFGQRTRPADGEGSLIERGIRKRESHEIRRDFEVPDQPLDETLDERKALLSLGGTRSARVRQGVAELTVAGAVVRLGALGHPEEISIHISRLGFGEEGAL
jgi:hypothetical protein